jgi:hypothetical protein
LGDNDDTLDTQQRFDFRGLRWPPPWHSIFGKSICALRMFMDTNLIQRGMTTIMGEK